MIWTVFPGVLIIVFYDSDDNLCKLKYWKTVETETDVLYCFKLDMLKLWSFPKFSISFMVEDAKIKDIKIKPHRITFVDKTTASFLNESPMQGVLESISLWSCYQKELKFLFGNGNISIKLIEDIEILYPNSEISNEYDSSYLTFAYMTRIEVLDLCSNKIEIKINNYGDDNIQNELEIHLVDEFQEELENYDYLNIIIFKNNYFWIFKILDKQIFYDLKEYYIEMLKVTLNKNVEIMYEILENHK
ncbi:hypothetical protein U3516DRAFT_770099 [Neocallimastix sp. 'constans']